MAFALISIGLPGSGKTTVLKKLADEYHLTYINKDEIREELLGSVHDQSKNRMVWLESQKRTENALRNGEDVVMDSTYIERWKRKELIMFLRKSGADRVIGLYFNTPFEESRKRNRNRERAVSDETMEWMERQITKAPPSLSEGYDALYTLEDLGSVREELRRI